MKKKIAVLALALTLSLSGSALASVTYDSSTGIGTVGKGDVQLALNYNNAQMQANASSLVFSQESEDEYLITVEWDTAEGKKQKHHTQKQHKTSTLADTVSYDTKVKKQVVGFNLTGISSTVVDGPALPVVGDILVDNENIQKTVTAVTLLSHTESGLKVNGVVIPIAPPVVEGPVLP
ncbi:hypothetical protein [Paenibacillus montanisoli]|uniref:hypothetical protein n=1 Tax=Paenibacillus montanisoli TaxID=2081970 RepID=UPI0010579C7B|nr:hypothetical protein [Paenibacillus montanisoli]